LFKDLTILEKQSLKGNVTQTVRPFKTNWNNFNHLPFLTSLVTHTGFSRMTKAYHKCDKFPFATTCHGHSINVQINTTQLHSFQGYKNLEEGHLTLNNEHATFWAVNIWLISEYHIITMDTNIITNIRKNPATETMQQI